MKLRSFNPYQIVALAALFVSPLAHAVDGTWLGTTGNWTASGIWSGGTLADGTGFTANFSGVDIALDQTITLNGNRTIGNITFTDDTTSSNNLLITGNTLTLDRADSVAPNIDVTQAARQLSISSIIAGNDGIRKSGTGTLRLTAANTFTGGLTINAGTVFTNAAPSVNALSSGKVTIGDVANTGASAELLYIGTTGNNSFSNLIDVRGNGTATIRVLGYNPTFSGAINLGNNLTVISNNNFGSTMGFSGGFTGTGNLVIQSNAANGGASSAITLSGTTVNMAGSITNSGTTTSTTASHTTISAVIGTNVTGITQNSTNSQLILTGNNTFTGNIAISAGTLNANLGQGGNNPTSGALGNPSTAGRQVTIASGASLNFNTADVLGQGGTGNTLLTLIANGGTIRNNGNILNTLGPVQLNGGTLTSTASGDGFKLTGTVTVGGSALSTIGASGAIGASGVITYDVADAVAGIGNDLNVTAVLSGIFGTGGIIKTGVGTMTLTAQNTFTGGTRIDNGTLTHGHATNTLANTGAVNVNGGTLALGTNTDTVGAVTLTSGSITGSGAGTLTGTGYDVRSGSVSAILAGSSVALTKTTAGTVTLSGVNSYTGATAVNAGKLVVSGSIGNSAVAVSGSGTILTTDAAASFGSTLAINNGAILAAGDAGVAGTATVTGATTFNDGSIFSWDVNATGTGFDKLISTGSLVDGDAAGGSVFRIVASDSTFGNAFWSSNQSWTNVMTTDGSTAIANWANVFNSISLVDSNFSPISPAAGSFSVTGSSVNWTAVPEPTSALAGLLIGAGLLRRRRNA